jgi:GT2 family glycosyltransferase
LTELVGVVTVTYNSAVVIDGFMKSMLAQLHKNFILFIIDNASRDKTLALLETYHDGRIKIVSNCENVGVAEANNQGIAAAIEGGCQFVLLINNDTEFEPNLVSEMILGAEAHHAAMLTPKIMFFEPRNVIWCAGGSFRPWLGYSTCHNGEGEADSPRFDLPRPIAYAPTCCMLIAISVFKKIGLMDPRYFVYYDDTDFCWRAHKFGIRFWYDPRATLYHKVSSLTGWGQSDFGITYSTRNKVYFVLKNLGPVRVVYCLLIYQLIFIYKLLTGTDSRRIFVLKWKSYLSGIRLYFGRKS